MVKTANDFATHLDDKIDTLNWVIQSCAKELEWSLFQDSGRTIHSAETIIPHIKGLDFSQKWSKKKSKWPTQKIQNGRLKKPSFSSSTNSQYFFMKFSWKILRIGAAGKWGFFEAAILNVLSLSWIFFSSSLWKI